MFISENGIPSFGASLAWPSEEIFTMRTLFGAVEGEEAVDWRVGKRRIVK
jgi:hypothetical protein